MPDNIAHKFSDEYCNISIIDKEAVLKQAKELKIDGIMSFACDPGVVTAAFVAEKMGLPFQCSYQSAEILQDKAYSYYKVGRNFLPDFETDLGSNDYIYIVNYYGQISNDILLQLKEKYKNIIFDNVQAFFQKPVQEIDTIYSCRKFFGVPDGAYLSTDCFLEEDLPEDVSSGRLKHLLGRFESGSASDYYQDFQKNDDFFKTLELRKLSKLTHNILGAIDYENVRKKREQNYNYLYEHLKNYNEYINFKKKTGL